MSVDAALEECRACAGTQFDPAVVDALVRVVGSASAA
jgi:HD-GYP domain-containing protein (c-di-GMP phosphodiesterase class II)